MTDTSKRNSPGNRAVADTKKLGIYVILEALARKTAKWHSSASGR